MIAKCSDPVGSCRRRHCHKRDSERHFLRSCSGSQCGWRIKSGPDASNGRSRGEAAIADRKGRRRNWQGEPLDRGSAPIAFGHDIQMANLTIAADLVVGRSRRKVGEQAWRHLRSEVLKEAAGLRDVAVPHMDEREIVGAEAPVGHHLDETASRTSAGRTTGGRSPMPAPATNAGAKPA